MKRYSLSYEGKTVGYVELVRKGMYVSLRSRFACKRSGKFRLCALDEGRRTELCLCVPYGAEMGAECCVPAKEIAEKTVTFGLVNEEKREYEAVCSGQPFGNIGRLSAGRFAVIGGNKSILFENERYS